MLEMLFNRWRGTGIIFWKINGNIIYAIYWAILVGCFSTWYLGLVFAGLYILGESFSWGKWVGYITMHDRETYIIRENGDYINDDGTRFPFIHYISNFFINQRKDYLNYCRLALFVRGLFWWILPLSFLYFIDLIVLWQYLFGLVVVSFGFPIAAEISRYILIEYKSKYLHLSKGWENQEALYGLFHFIGITLMLFI